MDVAAPTKSHTCSQRHKFQSTQRREVQSTLRRLCRTSCPSPVDGQAGGVKRKGKQAGRNDHLVPPRAGVPVALHGEVCGHQLLDECLRQRSKLIGDCIAAPCSGERLRHQESDRHRSQPRVLCRKLRRHQGGTPAALPASCPAISRPLCPSALQPVWQSDQEAGHGCHISQQHRGSLGRLAAACPEPKDLLLACPAMRLGQSACRPGSVPAMVCM